VTEQLKQLALAATQGPWETGEDDYGDEHWFGGKGEGQVYVNRFVSGGCKRIPLEWAQLKADAAYIAAASPDVVLALIAQREADEALMRDCLDWFEADSGSWNKHVIDALRARLGGV
jgi:hypothetical protein